MKNTVYKVLAVALSFCLLAGSLSVSAGAVSVGAFGTTAIRRLSDGFGSFADALVRGVAGLFPSPAWPDKAAYVPTDYYAGTAGTVTGEQWLCGFASESVVPPDVDSGKYNSAGYTGNLPTNYVNGVLDDQRIVAVCLGTGGKTAVFLSLDGFGMTGTNVRKIRARLAEFAAANGIVSINITVSHTHYAIDTHGLGTDMGKMLKFNLVNLLTRQARPYNSTNEDFMNGVFAAAENTVRAAFAALQGGNLYYGRVAVEDLISDSRAPRVFDENAHRLRFVPRDTRANEIWLVNMGLHPTSLDMGTKLASADFPGAIVRYAKELAGADAAFYQGAISGIYSDVSGLGISEEGLGTLEEVNAVGLAITQRLLSITNEAAVTPKLNIRHKELFLPIDNSFLQLACRLQIINNTVLHTSGKLADIEGVTEIGMCELGDTLAIALMPGELSPELLFGGTLPASEAWTGTDWAYPPMNTQVGARTLLCFGLTNDQIGYIVPDNDYANTYAQLFAFAYAPDNDHYQEMISLGKHTASALMAAFAELITA